MGDRVTSSEQSDNHVIHLGTWDREAGDLDRITTWGPTSDRALEHLRFLIVHRPDDDELTIVLRPERCVLCEELAIAYLGRVEGNRS